MEENENNALEIVQLINAIVDKEYENIKGQGKILEGIEKLHQQIIFFLCDGEVETCKKRSCYKNGGECKHTSDIRHAKNFHKENNSPYSAFYEILISEEN